MPTYEVDEDVSEVDRNKREILEPFTSFYKVKSPKNDRSKRDARLGSLGSFTSFYLPKAFGVKDNKVSIFSPLVGWHCTEHWDKI